MNSKNAKKTKVIEYLFSQNDLSALEREIISNSFSFVDFDAEHLEADIYLNKLSHWPKGGLGYNQVKVMSERILRLKVKGDDNSIYHLFSGVSYEGQETKLSLSIDSSLEFDKVDRF